MKVRIHVLLASYNGSRFLQGQLDSIESQTLPVSRITVRDDGSTDSTLTLVQEWAAERPNVNLVRGPRLGVTKNFFALLTNQDEESDFFAFSDQDDIWLPDKMENAVSGLSRHSADEPLMYCSRLEYVDERLRHLGYSRIPRRVDFGNALVENIATGCTVVLNRRARDLIVARLPEKALVHDWWCYLVVSAFGKVIYDPRPSIKYRQHGNNQIGGTSSAHDLFRRRLARFRMGDWGAKRLSSQALAFERYFGDILAPHHKRVLERFLTVRGNLWTRLSYNAAMDVWRQSRFDTAILRTLILMGRV
jgi:glycosyltransferase involved in cell wall biosynthesis